MSAPTLDRPSITCGKCKITHHSVADVKACHATIGTPVTTRPTLSPEVTLKVPDGRYAIVRLGRVEFYRVQSPTEGRWAGYTFVTRQAGDDEFPVRNRQSREDVLTVIGRDVKAAMVRYGLEIGACGKCGRTLTHPESIAAGIGPRCAGKL